MNGSSWETSQTASTTCNEASLRIKRSSAENKASLTTCSLQSKCCWWGLLNFTKGSLWCSPTLPLMIQTTAFLKVSSPLQLSIDCLKIVPHCRHLSFFRGQGKLQSRLQSKKMIKNGSFNDEKEIGPLIILRMHNIDYSFCQYFHFVTLNTTLFLDLVKAHLKKAHRNWQQRQCNYVQNISKHHI